MKQYINKSALVAEIERRKEAISNSSNENNRELAAIRGAQQYELINLALFIGTLEVEEVDLEKELGKYLDTNDIEFSHQIKLLDFAKHFFELGLKMNNPITAADRGTVEEIIVALKHIEQDHHIDLTKEIQWLRDIVKKGE